MNDSVPDIPGVDIRGTLDRLGLDYEDLVGILTKIPDSFRKSVADIEAGLAAGDNEAVRIAAHTLAGLAANFGVNRVHLAARAVESAARENRPADLPSLLSALRPPVEEASAALEKLQ